MLTLNLTEMHHTVHSMEVHGGGFCKALAQAWYKADRANKHRIETAFEHLLSDFAPGSPFYEG